MEQKDREKVIKLVKQLKQNKTDEGYTALYEYMYPECYARVRSLCYQKGQKLNDTDDLVQQVMLKVWNKVETLENEKTFFGWFNTIIENTCYDYWNLYRNKNETVLSDYSDQSEDEERNTDYIFEKYDANEEFNAINDNERIEIVYDAIHQLDESTQDIIRKFYFDELSIKDISLQMEMKEGTVKSKLSRGRTQLSESMEKEAKKRGFKLYNLSFFGMFLYLHEKTIQVDASSVIATTGTGATAKHVGKTVKASRKAATISTKTAVVSSTGTKIAIASVAAAVCIAGGTVAVKKMNANSSSSEKLVTPAGIEDEKTSEETEIEEVKTNAVSIVKRGIDIDEVRSFLLDGEGHSVDIAANVTPDNFDVYDSGYQENAIIVGKDSLYGIYDYDGNELFPISKETINKFGLSIGIVTDDAEYISKDYTGIDPDNWGIGPWDYASYILSVKNNKVEIGDGWHNENPDVDHIDYVDDGTVILVPSDKGVATIDTNLNVIAQMNGYNCTGQKEGLNNERLHTVMANGFVFLSETNDCTIQVDDKTHTGKHALFNAITGEQLTDFEFTGMGYMWDGYAPVKKDDKWGFVDETGKLVVDYIFDDAGSLYDSKAYVKYNGEWMIINVVESLADGEITTETMDAALA